MGSERLIFVVMEDVLYQMHTRDRVVEVEVSDVEHYIEMCAALTTAGWRMSTWRARRPTAIIRQLNAVAWQVSKAYAEEFIAEVEELVVEQPEISESKERTTEPDVIRGVSANMDLSGDSDELDAVQCAQQPHR